MFLCTIQFIHLGAEKSGGLISPLFQIRQDVLHFLIGGGSAPQNGVALNVGDVELRTASGNRNVGQTVNGMVMMVRGHWNVSGLMHQCARIRIFDLSVNQTWGNTLFDDLRAAPRSLKGNL